jgi:hypothetical protein
MKIFKMLIVMLVALLICIPVQAGSLADQLNVDEKVVERTAMSLPASTQTSIFAIAGGPIEILSLIGEVTTVIQTQSCSLKIVADPTTPATDTDLCAVLDVTADAVATYYSLVTSTATALAEYTNGVGPTMGGVFSLTVPIGNIDVYTNATNTGAITWRMRYRPLAHGVIVTAE